MAYSRGKYYIWSTSTHLCLLESHKEGIEVPENLINVFLASLAKREGELEKRIKKGDKLIKEAEKEESHLNFG